MKIHVLPSGPLQTIGYLLTDARLGEAVLVDAPGGILAKIQPVLTQERCALKQLWLTHGHWDHTQEAAKVMRETGAGAYGHADDRVLFETPSIMEERLGHRLGLEPLQVSRWITQGDRLKALGREFEVRHVPGHCPGNVLFYQAEAKTAFVGDALFKDGVGRWDLPGGDFDVLARSIREQIYTLPDDTIIFPGHGPRTLVAAEKTGNPYVAAVAQ